MNVDTAQFWKRRLYEAHASGRGLHTAIYDIDTETWQDIQNQTKGFLQRFINPGDRVLDMGCGYGACYDLMPEGVDYLGIDISDDLIEIARLRYPSGKFEVVDILDNTFRDDEFNIILCRSIREMVINNLGIGMWGKMLTEMHRIAPKVLSIEFENGVTANLLENPYKMGDKHVHTVT